MGNATARPKFSQCYVVVGPATAAIRHGVMHFDDAAGRDAQVRELVGRGVSLVSAWSDDTDPMRLYTSESAASDYHLPMNEWLFPLRGSVVYMHRDLGGLLPADPTVLFRLLDKRRQVLRGDLDRPSCMPNDHDGPTRIGSRWIDEIKQGMVESRDNAMRRFEEDSR